MKFQTSVAVAAVALFTLAACGTGAVPTAVSNPTASPAGGPTAGASSPTATPTSTTTPVGAVDLCALLSVDDVVTVLGTGGWVEGALSKPGPSGYCKWDNAISHAFVLTSTTVDLPLATIKSGGDGVDMTVSGHAGYLKRLEQNSMAIWVDLGGLLLVVQMPTSSNADDDQAAAQTLAEIAVGNM
jgi:hypothetical protein